MAIKISGTYGIDTTKFQQTDSAVIRNGLDKQKETVSVTDFGAVGDGERDDTEAIQAALNTGKTVYFPSGIYRCTDELTILTHGQRILGAGRGSAYQRSSENISPILNWTDNTTLLFDTPTNGNVRYVKTRIVHRAAVGSAQDAPLSTAINVQGEFVAIEDICIRLNITDVPENVLTDNPTNFGANWDVGIFNGCRVQMLLRDVSVIGYFRKASIWYDVTQSAGMPRFTNHRGQQFPTGTVENGADGCKLENVFTYGGKWGIKVQGGQFASGNTDYGPDYFDAVANALVSDGRGVFGFSDFIATACSFYGPEHHTLRRIQDIAATPNVLTDDCGGAMSIDGIAGNVSKKIQGHRFIGCRFSTWAPFNVRLVKSNRDLFIGCHLEQHGNDGLSSTGAVLGSGEVYYYGPFAKTSDTTKTKIIACNGSPYNVYFPRTIEDMEVFSDSDESNHLGKEINIVGEDVLGDETNRLVIRSGADSGTSTLCFGDKYSDFSSSLRYYNNSKLLRFRMEESAHTDNDALDITMVGSGLVSRISAPGTIELRTGDNFTAYVGPTNILAIAAYGDTGNVEVAGRLSGIVDNTQYLGSSTMRWANIYTSALSTGASGSTLQVVGSRKTGWAAPTGTATRTTFATSTVTTELLAQRVKALIDDLISHGLIGS